MNRNPVVGDVITIGKSKTEQVVVYARRLQSVDSLRGDCYYAYVFKVVSLNPISKINPKEKIYTIKEGASMCEGECVSLKHISFLRQVKVKERHEITYTIKE